MNLNILGEMVKSKSLTIEMVQLSTRLKSGKLNCCYLNKKLNISETKRSLMKDWYYSYSKLLIYKSFKFEHVIKFIAIFLLAEIPKAWYLITEVLQILQYRPWFEKIFLLLMEESSNKCYWSKGREIFTTSEPII